MTCHDTPSQRCEPQSGRSQGWEPAFLSYCRPRNTHRAGGCLGGGDPATGARTHYVVDPETAPVVIRIFNAIDNGAPVRQIARELEQEGIPTPFQVLEARGQLP